MIQKLRNYLLILFGNSRRKIFQISSLPPLDIFCSRMYFKVRYTPRGCRIQKSAERGGGDPTVKADRAKIEKLLKTARGQLDGILRMVEQDRYCIDISTQIMAAQAILTKVNREILLAHMNSCILKETDESNREERIAELTHVMEKLLK